MTTDNKKERYPMDLTKLMDLKWEYDEERNAFRCIDEKAKGKSLIIVRDLIKSMITGRPAREVWSLYSGALLVDQNRGVGDIVDAYRDRQRKELADWINGI